MFAPLYAHALIALILLFSLCVQARLGTPTLDELGGEPAEDCSGLVPWQRLRTSPRTDDYENITEVNLRVWHGFVCAAARKMRPTDASAATPSADSQVVRQRLGTTDGCGEENSSRRWSCCSCGATPPESGASSAAAQPKKRPVSQRQNFAEAVVQERRRVQATLPMESRSQADSEATDVKIDEDPSKDRDKGNTKEIANKLKDLDSHIRQLQPCARDEGVASLLEEKKQERAQDTVAELQASSPASTPGHGSQGEGQQSSRKCQAGRGGHRGAFSPQACGGRSVQGHASPAQQQCRTVGAEISDEGRQCRAVSLRITRGPDAGSATLADPVSRGVSQMPQRRSAGRLRRLQQGARAQPGLRGAGAHRRDTCHSACACSRDAAGSWSFRTVSEAQSSPNGPVPRSAPAGCPWGHSSIRPNRHIHTGAQR